MIQMVSHGIIFRTLWHTAILTIYLIQLLLHSSVYFFRHNMHPRTFIRLNCVYLLTLQEIKATIQEIKLPLLPVHSSG